MEKNFFFAGFRTKVCFIPRMHCNGKDFADTFCKTNSMSCQLEISSVHDVLGIQYKEYTVVDVTCQK